MDSELLPIIDFTKVRKKRVVKSEKAIESEDLSNIVIEKKKAVVKDSQVPESDAQKTDKPREFSLEDEYSYDFLLDRIKQFIKIHNPDLTSGKGSIKIPIPAVTLIGRSRSSWDNFEEFYSVLNRTQDHLYQYVLGELGVSGTIGGENQLLLKSKVTKQQIESILRKYIHDYVQCPNCRLFKTLLKKDISTRLQQIYCENCKSENTVKNLKSLVKAGR